MESIIIQTEQNNVQLSSPDITITQSAIIRFAHGKEILTPQETIEPVSQTIKKYIEGQFLISKLNTE